MAKTYLYLNTKPNLSMILAMLVLVGIMAQVNRVQHFYWVANHACGVDFQLEVGCRL